ncbi:MAG: cytochrome P450, partial [Pseudomonadota bacterium]
MVGTTRAQTSIEAATQLPARSSQLYRFDLQGQAFKRDPLPTFARMRAAGPLVRNRVSIVGSVTFACTHATCSALLKDETTFSVDVANASRWSPLPLLQQLPGIRVLTKHMIQADHDEHRRLRGAVDHAFRRAVVARLEPRIEALTAAQLDVLENAPVPDVVAHVARDLPLTVICNLLGLPAADRSKFKRWMADMAGAASLRGVFAMMPSLRKMSAYLRAHIDQCRRAPGQDLISELVTAPSGSSGRGLSDQELLSTCFLLFAAGHETTSNLMSGGIFTLLQHRSQWDLLCADPGRAQDATNELLRHYAPVQMGQVRHVTRSTTLGGRALQRGDMVMPLLGAANSDPQAFAAPERFDVMRSDMAKTLSFGAGQPGAEAKVRPCA